MLKDKTFKKIGFGLLISSLLSSQMACTPRNPEQIPANNSDLIKLLQDSFAQNQKIIYENKLKESRIRDSKTKNINNHEPRFDLKVQDTPAKSFFAGLVKGTKYSIVVSPEIQGRINLDLRHVTVHEALQAVRDTYGFEYESTSYGFKVFVPALQNKVFYINYLNVHRFGNSRTSVNPGKSNSGNINNNSLSSANLSNNLNNGDKQDNGSSSSQITTLSDFDFWNDLKANLNSFLGGKDDGHTLFINPQAGMIMIRAYPQELRVIEDYLKRIDSTLNRQVILQAKVIEVELKADYATGINWNIFGAKQEGNQKNGDLSPFTNIFSLNTTTNKALGLPAGNPDFELVLKLLSTQGKIKVLSNPHISTVNNQKAVIKVGKDEYFITNVSNTTATSTTGLNNQQNVELTPFFSGIALDVTPQIQQNGEVILHIHPMVSQVADVTKSFVLNNQNQSIPSASTTIRESDNIVHAHSGQVVVLGGLMQNSLSDNKGNTPLLGEIPLVKHLFRDVQKTARKSELVILLKPIVVNDHTWNKILQEHSSEFKSLDTNFGFQLTNDRTNLD